MNTFQSQLEAIGSALLLIQKLPEGTVWSLTCTNDDNAESPSVLNIFASMSEWDDLTTRLKLAREVDKYQDEMGNEFICYRQKTLYISLIDVE